MNSPGCPIRGVSEVALWVEDVERTTAFYCDHLGFEVESVDEGRNAFLRAGDFLLVLFSPNGPGTPLAEDFLERRGGPGQIGRGAVYHVAFRVEPEALDEFAERLKSRGLEVRGPVTFATGRRSWFMEDPDEHYLELTDR